MAPKAYEPSRSEFGTDRITSSLSEETKGIIITPMARPAANALSADISIPIESPKFLSIGASVKAAKNPYTTVGIPANISMIGFAISLTLEDAYSAR